MKNKVCSAIIGLALLAGVHRTLGQAIVINSLSQNGVLVCSGLQTGTVATVQWASTPAGPWQTNWASLAGVTVGNNGTITASVPMFYRVLGVPATTNPPAGMALIPAGTFTMGDTLDGESDAITTNIYVSAFYMDTNLVRTTQWETVYGYATSHGYSFANSGTGQGWHNPVQTVDWFDCVKWSNARSAQAGLTPVYYTDAGFTRVFTNGDKGTTVYANWTAKGYRLPTEAEWEKAARGGLSGQRFPWGNTISESQANYYSTGTNYYSYDLSNTGYNQAFVNEFYPYTSPVGYFAANGYGLYDMAGNVWEWCWDWYATTYGQPTDTNPTGPVGTLSVRVLRGGNWGVNAHYARCAYRDKDTPGNASDYVGFRCVRGL